MLDSKENNFLASPSPMLDNAFRPQANQSGSGQFAQLFRSPMAVRQQNTQENQFQISLSKLGES